jgi:hypothetical protein
LKVDLLPPSRKGEWDKGTYPPGITPDLLVACYLSWVLGRLKETLRSIRQSGLTMNVAAPMNHLEDQRLKNRYRHVINAAWQATFGSDLTPVCQGAELSELLPSFKSLLDREPAHENQTSFQVLPETVAPLVSLWDDPRAGPGLYLMADMGAGTTELSVSLVADHDGDRRIACYFDESILLGGDQFSENDDSNGSSPEHHVVGEERLRKQLFQACRNVWHTGYLKDAFGCRAQKEEWKHLNIILAGGGFRRCGLREVINAAFPVIQDYPERWDFVDYRPAGLRLVEHPTGFTLDGSWQLLAVAHGLSKEKGTWGKIDFPGDVPPEVHEPRPEDPFELSHTLQGPG